MQNSNDRHGWIGVAIVGVLTIVAYFTQWFGNGMPELEALDDVFHHGLIEYELSCLPCHGVVGKGDGPKADNLDAEPADLTQIAKLNDGKFPAERLALMIDGREVVAAHGLREMPVWGERYRIPVPDDAGERNVEAEARLRINALVLYVEAIQE